MAKKDKDAVVINDDKRKKLSPNIITAIVSIVIIVLGYAFFVRPAQSDLRELSMQSPAELENTITQKKAQLTRMENILAQIEASPAGVDALLEHGLPSTPDLNNALVNITALMQESGLGVTSISFVEEQETNVRLPGEQVVETATGELKEIQVKVGIDRMTYTTLKRFLANAESSLRLVRVNQFSFGVDQTTGTLELTIFYLP